MTDQAALQKTAHEYVGKQIAIMKKHDSHFEPIEPRKIERAVNDTVKLFRRLERGNGGGGS